MRYDRKPPGPRSGFTLLETLVVLAVISLVAATALSALRGPSPDMLLRQKAAGLSAQLAQARLVAIRTGQLQVLDLADLDQIGLACDNANGQIVLFPDGVVTGGDICLTSGPATLRLRPAPLTGKLVPVPPS